MKKTWIVWSWALYDFAGTIFSMNIITLYFVLWVTIDMQGEDVFYSIALASSMLLAALTAPWFGRISDRLGKKMPFLIIFTVAAFICIFPIGFIHNLFLGLVVFAIGNFCFQLGDVFYNALLPQVSTNHNTGKISGFGKSFGYLGAVVGLVIVGPFVLHYGRQMAFIPTALLFIIFALPCFFLVKDPAKPIKRTTNWADIKQHPHLLRALLAIFLTLNAVSTVFVFMSVYIKKVAGFTDANIQIFYITCSVVAIIGAYVSGIVTDLWGAKKTFMAIIILWIIAIIIASIAAQQWLFWFIGPLVGICLGGVWTSARALVAQLAPAHMEGEVFGLYGLVTKLSAIIAPLLWGISIWGLQAFGLIKYRITVVLLVIFLILGAIILAKVPNRVADHA